MAMSADNQKQLNFYWPGDGSHKDVDLVVVCNGSSYNFSYQSGCNVNFPLDPSSDKLHICVKRSSGKNVIAHTFDIESGHDYYIELCGNINSLKGMGLKLSEPDSYAGEDDHIVWGGTDPYYEYYDSFLFPISGFVRALFHKDKRLYNIIGAGGGFSMSL